MGSNDTKLYALEILRTGPVIPVVVLGSPEQAAPLARAALEGIRRIAAEVPEMTVGAGTVLTPDDLRSVAQAGGRFAISPGLPPALFAAAHDGPIPLIPDIATPSELMLAQERGFTELKFFPAEAAGGVRMLKSLHGPFPKITFCPTGGVSEQNYQDYLTLGNVTCVGGSWLAPPELIEQGDWDSISRLAAAAAL